MTNVTVAAHSTSDASAVHLHAADIVSGITRKIIVKNYLSAITRAESDAVVHKVQAEQLQPVDIQLPSA